MSVLNKEACPGCNHFNVVCKRQQATDKGRLLDLFFSFNFVASNVEETEPRKINIIVENKVGAKEGVSNKPPVTPNITMQYIVSARNNVKVSIAPEAQGADDDEKKFIREELEAAFERAHKPMPNTGSFKQWFTQKLFEGKLVEEITKDDFFTMLDDFMEMDKEMFG
jgi:hypothetical protein